MHGVCRAPESRSRRVGFSSPLVSSVARTGWFWFACPSHPPAKMDFPQPSYGERDQQNGIVCLFERCIFRMSKDFHPFRTFFEPNARQAAGEVRRRERGERGRRVEDAPIRVQGRDQDLGAPGRIEDLLSEDHSPLSPPPLLSGFTNLCLGFVVQEGRKV